MVLKVLLKPVHKSLCLLIRGWGAAQAAQKGCRHPPPPSFAAGYLSHVYYRFLLAGEDAQRPFPGASYSAHSSTFPIHSTPCPPALDLASASMRHPLTTLPTLCPSFYLFPPIQGLFSHLLSLLWALSFSHPTSSNPQQAGGVEDRGKLEDKMGTPQQQGDIQVRQEREEEAVRLGRIWVKRRLWGVVKIHEHTTGEISVHSCPRITLSVVNF